MPDRLAVSYLFSRSCPSHREGRDLLDEAARRAGLELAVEVTEVTSDRQAHALAYVGSPTYRAAGRDLFAPEGPAHAADAEACRLYRLPDDRFGPLPDIDDLTAALRAAADQETA